MCWPALAAQDELPLQNPATDAEALAPPVLEKRIPADWLQQCFLERPPLGPPREALTMAGQAVFAAAYFGVLSAYHIVPGAAAPAAGVA